MRGAVAAVEDDVHWSFGWRGGGRDGEVGLRFDLLWGEDLVFVLPGGAAHGICRWGEREKTMGLVGVLKTGCAWD